MSMTMHSLPARADVEALRATLRGPLIQPGDAEYDDARKVWNGMIDKHPALIARCTETADVVAAVHFAREHGLLVAVRGGAHNVAGYATCDGGIVIDLSPMQRVDVDPATKTARAQAGATWGDVDAATQAYGLATPGGEVSVTGIAGLTLSGGIGYLRRKHGLSCDNLVSVEIVTADGRVLRASEHDHPDLFWGLRGGGGNFGIVTSFEYRLHDVGPEVAMLSIAYPFEEAKRLMRVWREFTQSAPDEASTAALGWSVPPAPDFPAEIHGRPVLIFDGMYAGPVDEGEALFAPLRQLGTPVFDASGPSTYLAAQSAFSPLFPDGRLYYWKSTYLRDVGDDVVDAFIAWMGRRPQPSSVVALRHLGGAMGRVPEDATAFGNRSAPFNLSIDATWDDPASSETTVAWARAFWRDLQRFSTGGVYLNFAGSDEEGTALVRAGHGANFERLVALKTAYDPHNLFRVNQNIRPSGRSSR